MPDIRYVCISDMHLGEETSLLTCLQDGALKPDCTRPSEVLEQLVACLRYLIERNEDQSKKPILILNGDILEFALALDNSAIMAFREFIKLIAPTGENRLFDKIFYIPGNHDHHIWEGARESQYADHIAGKDKDALLEPPWHKTEMFIELDPKPTQIFLFRKVFEAYGYPSDFQILAAYPNLGLIFKAEHDSGAIAKCVAFHHGHYIERIYMLMSEFLAMVFPENGLPDNVDELEAQNYAWVDFFWSMMGRSGTGEDIDKIYEARHYPERVEELVGNLAGGLLGKIPIPGIDNFFTAEGLKYFLGMMANLTLARERFLEGELLTEDARAGLKEYIQLYLKNQIESELKTLPQQLTFVFGHTHKPFADHDFCDGFVNPVKVYNTGGWVAENLTTNSVIGGAVVLLDETLNTVSLRMHNEEAFYSNYAVRVEEELLAGEAHSDFHNRISELVDPKHDPWKSYSACAAEAVQERAYLLNKARSL